MSEQIAAGCLTELFVRAESARVRIEPVRRDQERQTSEDDSDENRHLDSTRMTSRIVHEGTARELSPYFANESIAWRSASSLQRSSARSVTA